ncbi:MAG: hypothetical protein HDT42_05055 [Ruminococcaceae bacterium]|nr:hypothetical protein [Oscillospiraceae bacterium]
MSSLNKFLKDYEREECKYLAEIAALISKNDAEVVKAVEFAIDNPKKYLKRNAERFDDRSIDFSDEDFTDEFEPEELLFLAMVDELDQHGYAFEVDWKCGLEDFIWSLEQMKPYGLISDVISHLELDKNDDVETWGKALNAALGDRARLGYIDIDSDSYVLIIVTPEVFAKISEIAEDNGHSVVTF